METARRRRTERHDVVVVGGGQAGLAMSHELTARGVEHVVLERERVAHRWRAERWDSLAFQFPNWSLRLPGWGYDGPDPDGFAGHDEIAATLERYAAALPGEVREGTPANSVRRAEGDAGWVVTTEASLLRCRAVVLATGPFQRPVVPAVSGGVPAGVIQLHARDYRNPGQLPEGAVLVVGSGGSGTQIAEELCAAGRTVHLAGSRHRWVPRRHRGRDAFWWLRATGALDRLATTLPGGRLPPGILLTGVDGGHDMHLRLLEQAGVRVHGSLLGLEEGVAAFAEDAEAIAAEGDEGCAQFLRAADEHAARTGLDLAADPPGPGTLPQRQPLPPRPRLDLARAGVTSVVWCTGYRLDLGWVDAPAAFDARGVPVQRRGVTPAEGLYVLGLHWMHTIASGLLFGVGDDAAHLAGLIAEG